MAQEISTRVQLAAEQIGEDEALTSDLTDPAATALLEWIGEQVQAADAAPDDEAFQQQVKAIRSAAKIAARTAADEDVSAALVVERAQAALASSAQPAQPQPSASVAAAAPTAVEQPASNVAPTTEAQPVPAQDIPATPASQAAAAAPAQDVLTTPTPDPSSITDSPRAQAAREGSLWNTLRRRLRRWTHRKG